jgi:hypothetical protein
MRMAWAVLMAAGVLAVLPGRGRADDAAAVVEQTVRATAGSDQQLGKLSNYVQTARGTLTLPTGDVPVSRTAYVNPPDRIKYDAQIGQPGQRQQIAICLNGLKGWNQLGGPVMDMTPPQYDVMQDEAHFLWVASLVPLKQKSFTLTALPRATVAGKPADGVKVSRAGRGDVQLFFDAGSHLLVKGTYKAREAGLPVAREVFFTDPRDFDGLRLPMKITVFQNGKKIEDWSVEGYKFPGKFEGKVFEKP